MKLSKLEFNHLAAFLKGLAMHEFPAGDRLNITRLNPAGEAASLQALNEQTLQKLVNRLPAGKLAKVTSPVLKGVRHKVKAALLHMRRPLLDPESWPKVIRKMHKVSLSRAGLRAGPVGQIYTLHDKGMAVNLAQTHTWNERNAGDLIIMGRWFEITAEIGKAGSALQLKSTLSGSAGDVNAEMDRMYGPLPGDAPGGPVSDRMDFYVSCSAGPKFRPTNDSEGEVVLNPAGEVVNLVGGAVAGFAGASIPVGYGLTEVGGEVMDALGAAKSVVEVGKDPATWAYDAVGQHAGRHKSFDKTIFTVTIGITPGDEKYVTTSTTSLDSMTLLQFTLKALGSVAKA